ncbi:hypothetical protein EVAR_100448_1 [Eumeta japonica]|uniref:Uncharacterized protein n=1 Tax=Eumeta variegata TaxID=151549 RepID=A0A4C1ZVY4_EUMVA|nr:hypothetical protein EVAR_100448_1 [Eumeta japonica]
MEAFYIGVSREFFIVTALGELLLVRVIASSLSNLVSTRCTAMQMFVGYSLRFPGYNLQPSLTLGTNPKVMRGLAKPLNSRTKRPRRVLQQHERKEKKYLRSSTLQKLERL